MDLSPGCKSGRVSSYAGCMSPCFYWHTSGGYFYGVRLSNNFYWLITRTNVLCLLGFSAHSYTCIALSSFYDSLPSRDVQYPLRVVMLACFAYSLIPIQVCVPIPLVGSNACLICMFPHPTTVVLPITLSGSIVCLFCILLHPYTGLSLRS